jgi:hypothetical protein
MRKSTVLTLERQGSWVTAAKYSGSKNRPDVWMFFTKVNNPTHLLTWALTCECMKESPYHRLSMGPRVKRTG